MSLTLCPFFLRVSLVCPFADLGVSLFVMLCVPSCVPSSLRVCVPACVPAFGGSFPYLFTHRTMWLRRVPFAARSELLSASRAVRTLML